MFGELICRVMNCNCNKVMDFYTWTFSYKFAFRKTRDERIFDFLEDVYQHEFHAFNEPTWLFSESVNLLNLAQARDLSCIWLLKRLGEALVSKSVKWFISRCKF